MLRNSPFAIRFLIPNPGKFTFMLILSRKPGESIVVDGRIVIKIMRLEGDMVKVGIEAPLNVPVHRQEVYDEIQKNNQEALTQTVAKLPQLTAKANPTPLKAAPAQTPRSYAHQH
jgi:carbon storage regulator